MCAGLALLTGLASARVSAQTVEAYGMVDVSSRWVNNVAGGRLVSVDSGDQQSPRLGFRGTEELGDGLRAIFTLETGFNVDTGGATQGGQLFGRQALVGLAGRYGAVTVGLQYDGMVELGTYHAVQSGTGTLDWNIGDVDRVAGERLNNSVHYSFRKGPVLFSATYALGEVSGDMERNSAESLLLRYDGQLLSIGAAATVLHDSSLVPRSSLGIATLFDVPTQAGNGAPISYVIDQTTIVGVGGNYFLGQTTLQALFTRTELRQGAFRERLTAGDVALRIQASADAFIIVSASRTELSDSSWTRSAIAFDRLLSNRTDLYISALTEEARGPGTRAVLFTVSPASGSRQTAVLAGMRHRF
jgi:outer membrane protein OmpU